MTDFLMYKLIRWQAEEREISGWDNCTHLSGNFSLVKIRSTLNTTQSFLIQRSKMLFKQTGLNRWYLMEEERLPVVQSYLKAIPNIKIAFHLSQVENYFTTLFLSSIYLFIVAFVCFTLQLMSLFTMGTSRHLWSCSQYHKEHSDCPALFGDGRNLSNFFIRKSEKLCTFWWLNKTTQGHTTSRLQSWKLKIFLRY